MASLKEFYENLKKKRQDQKLSLEDIYRRSRLSIVYLEAIESGNIEKLPHGYERLYLRRYAKEIGLDEDEVIRDFDLMTGKLRPAQPAENLNQPEQSDAQQESPPPEPSRQQKSPPVLSRFMDNLNLDKIHKIFWISLAVITLIGAGYFTWQQYRFEKSNRDLEIKEITISELMENAEPEDSIAVIPATSNPEINPDPRPQFSVELRSLKRTWVREVLNRQDTTEYILPPGIRHSLQAGGEVQFLLGRADGVEIWFNGENQGVMGEPGQVASLVVNESGIVQKYTRKVSRADTASTAGDSASNIPAVFDSLRDTTIVNDAAPDSL